VIPRTYVSAPCARGNNLSALVTFRALTVGSIPHPPTYLEKSTWVGLRVSSVGCTLDDMSPEDRTERMSIRMSRSERAMIEALADRTGLSQADVVRLAVRQSYEKTFGVRADNRNGDAPPKPPRPPGR